MFKFTSNEIRDLIIAFIFISLSFAIASSGRNPSAIIQILPYILVGVGAGFIFHELGHKFVSMKYGYWAEFKLWPQGLLFALITSFFGFVFAAPGAVYTYANHITNEIKGKISIAGPIVNIILALIFYTKIGLDGNIRLDKYSITRKYELKHSTFELIICRLCFHYFQNTEIVPVDSESKYDNYILYKGEKK